MDMFRIRFIAKCTSCGYVDHCDVKRLGQSHVDWIRTAEKNGSLPDWKCRACKITTKAEIYQAVIETEK